MTYWITGNRFPGKFEGQSPIFPDSWHPPGLKYLNERTLQFLCSLAKDFINIYTQNFD